MIKFNLKVIIADYEQRTGRNWSFRALGKQMGLNKNTLNTIANNKSRRVDLDTFEKICGFFDIEPGDLLIRVANNKMENVPTQNTTE